MDSKTATVVSAEIINEGSTSDGSEIDEDEEAELNDLHRIRDLILEYKDDAVDLKTELNNWIQAFANSETDFIKGSQLPSLNTLSFAVLMNDEVLGKFYDFLVKKGKDDEAFELCQIILDGYNGYFGFNHHQEILSKLGIPLSMLSFEDYSDAAEVNDAFEQSVVTNYMGPVHKFTLTLQYNIASIFISQSKYAEALIIFQDVLQKRKSFFGPAHLETVKVETKIALCLRLLNRDEESLEMYKKNFKKLQRILGPNNPETLTNQFGIGLNLFFLRKRNEALEVFQQVSMRRKTKLGVNNPQTVEANLFIAYCYRSLGDFKKALEKFRFLHKLKLNTHTLGPSHDDALEVHFGVAQMLENLQEYPEALQEYKKLYAIQEGAYLEADHEDIFRTLHRMGRCLLSMKKYDEAWDSFHLILQKQKESLISCDDTSLTCDAQFRIALLLAKKGQFKESVQRLEDVYVKYKDCLGDHHNDTFHTKMTLDTARKQWGAMEMGYKSICSICLVNMEFLGETVTLPFECSHIFHFECIYPWLKDGNTCPECRSPMNPHTAAHFVSTLE